MQAVRFKLESITSLRAFSIVVDYNISALDMAEPECSSSSVPAATTSASGKINGSVQEVELDKIEDALAAIARGECVVVVDDMDRENEGDLIMAASQCTTERMAFIVRHSR